MRKRKRTMEREDGEDGQGKERVEEGWGGRATIP